MPVAAALGPLVGSLGSAVIGGIAGGSNKRPPTLSPQQQAAQNADIQAATKSATGPATIDPTQQAAIYDGIARSTTGANDAATHALVSRGLGRSGVLAGAIENNEAAASGQQTQANLSLQQQALQNQQFNRTLLNQLTQTPNIPGQSTTGAITAGAAAPLAYAAQTFANNNPYTPNQVPNTSNVGTGAATNTAINSGVFGTVPFINNPPANPQVNAS